MEKADVLESSIKWVEFKDAVFILTLDYPTISHHMAKTILHYAHNVYEKWMTASSSKFAAYIQDLCVEMTPLSLSIKFTFSIWRLKIRPTGISLSCAVTCLSHQYHPLYHWYSKAAQQSELTLSDIHRYSYTYWHKDSVCIFWAGDIMTPCL